MKGPLEPFRAFVKVEQIRKCGTITFHRLGTERLDQQRNCRVTQPRKRQRHSYAAIFLLHLLVGLFYPLFGCYGNYIRASAQKKRAQRGSPLLLLVFSSPFPVLWYDVSVLLPVLLGDEDGVGIVLPFLLRSFDGSDQAALEIASLSWKWGVRGISIIRISLEPHTGHLSGWSSPFFSQ